MSNSAVEEPTSQTVHDPVCHMDIIASESAGSSEHEGFTYYFCSLTCKQTFDEGPEIVLAAEETYTHQR